MPGIHRAFTWFTADGVLHIQKTHGVLSARVYRAVFVGLSTSAVIIVIGLLAWLVRTFLSPSRPPQDALLIFSLVLGFLLFFSPAFLFLREADKPHRFAVSASGLTSISLLSRRHYSLADVQALVARKYQTHARVPDGGTHLEAQLVNGRSIVLLESKHSESVGEFEPIITFFDQLKNQLPELREPDADMA
jgi:hypothetical protein